MYAEDVVNLRGLLHRARKASSAEEATKILEQAKVVFDSMSAEEKQLFSQEKRDDRLDNKWCLVSERIVEQEWRNGFSCMVFEVIKNHCMQEKRKKEGAAPPLTEIEAWNLVFSERHDAVWEQATWLIESRLLYYESIMNRHNEPVKQRPCLMDIVRKGQRDDLLTKI